MAKMKMPMGESGHLMTILLDLNRLNSLARHRLLADKPNDMKIEDKKQLLLMRKGVLWLSYQCLAYDDDNKLEKVINTTEKIDFKDWPKTCELFKQTNKTLRVALRKAAKSASFRQSEDGQFEVDS